MRCLQQRCDDERRKTLLTVGLRVAHHKLLNSVADLRVIQYLGSHLHHLRRHLVRKPTALNGLEEVIIAVFWLDGWSEVGFGDYTADRVIRVLGNPFFV